MRVALGVFALGVFALGACSSRSSPPPESPPPQSGGETGRRPVREPEPLAGDRPLQIEAGPTHFCARLRSGRVACWGDNHGGRLGDGTLLSADSPVLVQGVEGADALLPGALCAHTSAAGTLCWAGVDDCLTCPSRPGSRLRQVPDVTGGGHAIDLATPPCFVTAAGAVRCLGAEIAPPPDLPALRAVHRGTDFVCGVDRDDRLECFWRADGVRFDPGLPASQHVAVGAYHVCVIGPRDEVHCWGDRARGAYAAPQRGGSVDRVGPVTVIEDLRARAVWVGRGHSCAITTGDEVVCWGRRSYRAGGGDGIGRWTIDLPNPVWLAVGHDRACGLAASGEVYCWGLVDDASQPPRRPQLIAGLPVPDGAEQPPPREDAAQLREALRWADSPRRLAEIAALERGLVFGSVAGVRWTSNHTACFADHLTNIELGPALDGEWRCDTALARCVAQREGEATVFRWIRDEPRGRVLAGIIRYEGSAPDKEPPAVERELAGDPRGCGLWRRLWNRDESLAAGSLVVLHHPENDLGESPPVSLALLCGEDARHAALASMTVDPQAEGWTCDRLECSYDMGSWARGVFVFRRDAAGQPRLWIVGDDHEGEPPSAPPLLSKAIRKAKRHTCP